MNHLHLNKVYLTQRKTLKKGEQNLVLGHTETLCGSPCFLSPTDEYKVQFHMDMMSNRAT